MSNFFSGLIILFERPIRIGDRVEIAGAISEVREIAARATTLVTDENVAIVVPNSQFISERVTNWSRPGRLTAYRSMCRTRPTPNWSAACCSPPPPGIPTCCPSRLGLCEHIAVHGHQPHEILLTSQQLGLEPNATST